MRKLRFRAWNKKSRWMEHDLYLSFDGFIYQRAEFGYNTPHTEIEMVNNENIVLMQFTGLLDKNGREIWEGDIVRFDGHTWEEKFTACIIEKNGGFWADRKDGLGDYLGNFKYREVLGSIHEHPHLLREGE